MDCNELKAKVEDNYGINIIDMEKIKGSYKIKCINDNYCLKVINYNFNHFLFIIGAIKHLLSNGFINIPEIINTKSKKEYINISGSFAYLTKWIMARECNYDNPIEVLRASEKLAELHMKSYNFIITDRMKPRIGWFKWIANYTTRIEEIRDFQKRIQKKSKLSDFDSIYLGAMEEEIQRGEKAIEDLINFDYIEKMQEEIVNQGFCHHDFAHHNVLIGGNGEITVIDFDYCILDSHLHDLSSLLIRGMKNGKWDLNTTEAIIDAYRGVKRIEDRDIPIMASFMEFPQGYWQTGIQYYWEKQPWGEEFFIKRLQKILEDRQEKQEFIESFKTLKLS